MGVELGQRRGTERGETVIRGEAAREESIFNLKEYEINSPGLATI